MGIETTSEPWHCKTSRLPFPAVRPIRAQSLPSRPYLTNSCERRTHLPLIVSGIAVRRERKLPAHQYNRSLFPTPNPTHRMRCLVRLTRCLAVPAVLYVVVKPNHATLIRARLVVQVHHRPLNQNPGKPI